MADPLAGLVATPAKDDPLAGLADLPAEYKVRSQGDRDRFTAEHPIAKAAVEGAAVSGLTSLAGRGISMIPHPAAKVVGTALSDAPYLNTALGGASAAAGETVRHYGQPLLGQYTEPVATAVEFAAPLAAPKAGRHLYEMALGSPSAVAMELAPRARKLGFTLEPGQVRQGGSSYTGGTLDLAKKNQEIANRLTTQATGYATDSVTPKWFSKTFKALGQEFDQVYSKGNQFVIDKAAFDKLTDQLTTELSVGRPAAAAPVIATIKSIMGKPTAKLVEQLMDANMPPNIKQQVLAQLFPTGGITLSGEVIQRMRSDLGRVAARSQDSGDRMAARELIDTIDESVRATNPAVAAKLADIRPKYRATITLDELAKSGGIPEDAVSLERLGQMLRQRDRAYTRGESTNPLAEFGLIGETFGLRSLNETQQMKNKGEVAGKLKAAIKHIGESPLEGAAVGGAAGSVIPGVGTLTGAAIGGGLSVADMLRRGYTGQQIQMILGHRMRRPGRPALSAMTPGAIDATGEAIDAVSGPSDPFSQVAQ